MGFQVLGEIIRVRTIAVGGGIRILPRLRKRYGRGRWRKCKGLARIRLPNGRTGWAEIHWYEAHGIGRVELKLKRLVGDWS